MILPIRLEVDDASLHRLIDPLECLDGIRKGAGMKSSIKRVLPESVKRIGRRALYKGNVKPSIEFIEIVKNIVEQSKDRKIRIAEIGVDRGATTFEVVKLLRPRDCIDLFDVENCYLFKNIDALKNSAKCDINVFKNTSRLHDSYSWRICKIFRDLLYEKRDSVEIWDAVYLDGAHRFNVDAPTTCLVKNLLRKDGIVVFDDMNWTMAHSPTSNTRANWARYTDEQMTEPHVRLIVDSFMRTDDDFKELTSPDASRAIFRKIR